MFKLRALPFNPAQNPVAGELTCSYHYEKHHATYVNNLNNLIKNTEFENMGLYEILLKSSGAIFNNAAQIYNHDFYWDCIAKKSEPSDELKTALKANFSDFKSEFIKEATALFGSGWVWLAFNPQNLKLEIIKTANADTPVTDKKIPLLVVDVWEHAYYIENFNARPAYLEKFFDNINWEFASTAYKYAKKDALSSVKFYIDELHKI